MFESARCEVWKGGGRAGAGPPGDAIYEGHGRDGGEGDVVNDGWREVSTGSVGDKVAFCERDGAYGGYLARLLGMEKISEGVWKMCSVISAPKTQPGPGSTHK